MDANITYPLPPGYNPPLVTTDAQHRGAGVIICAAFGLVVILLSLLARIYLRIQVSPPFAADDIALASATALSIIQSVLIFVQVHRGFGTSIELLPAENLLKVRKLGYTADIFFILTLYGTKLCLAFFLARVSPNRSHTKANRSIIGVTSVCAVIAILLAAVKCETSQPWLTYRQNCESLKPQWETSTALDVLTELLLLAMSVYLVWGLHTTLWKKSQVVLAFVLRMPIIPLSITRTHYLLGQINSDNSPLVGVLATELTQVQLFYAIMSATIPCLRPFIAGFTTFYGAMVRGTVIRGSQIGSQVGKESKRHSMQPNASKGSGGVRSVDSMGRRVSRLANAGHQISAGQNSCEITSGPSSPVEDLEMSVRREVQWQVDSEIRGALSPPGRPRIEM